MNWLAQILDDLANLPGVGYTAGTAAAAEPTALAALAFVQHGRTAAARQAAEALVALQQPGGQVGVRSAETPGWPTSLAIVAWLAAERNVFAEPIARATAWLLANRGRAVEPSEDFGHNPALVGWAYAEQTHSWVEPTAFAVLALKAAGKADDPAAREGIAVLLDRQLPGGGLNYGNTYVLGQLLRSHVQPTGIALLALADLRQRPPETALWGSASRGSNLAAAPPAGLVSGYLRRADAFNDNSRSEFAATRVVKSLAWLQRNVTAKTTPLSLGWALLGLQAHGVELPQAGDWLAAAAARVASRDRSPHKLALLALAAKGWPA